MCILFLVDFGVGNLDSGKVGIVEHGKENMEVNLNPNRSQNFLICHSVLYLSGTCSQLATSENPHMNGFWGALCVDKAIVQ